MKSEKKKVFILGAGVAGLASGWKLSEKGFKVSVIEKNPFIGGMASSFKYKNFTLDYGPHKIFSLMEDVLNQVLTLLGKDNILRVKKKSRIYLNGKFMNYPVQLGDILQNLGVITCMLCGMSFLNASLKRTIKKRTDNSFEDWVTNRFGKKISDLIFSPYARKIWGDPKNLAVELASTRIAAPTLWEIIKQMILKMPSNKVINADYFYYPKKGVFEIAKAMAGKLERKKGKIATSTTLTQIKVKNGFISEIVYDNGKKEVLGKENILISTIPLPILLHLISPKPPDYIFTAARKLKTRNLILFYLILGKKHVSTDSWLFFPESKYIFNRIFEQKNFSLYIIPKNMTTLCIEITCDKDSPIWKKTTDELFEEVIKDLAQIGLVERKEVKDYFDKRLSFAYPIYDLNFQKNLETIYKYTDTIKNLYTVGRQGAFGYTGTLDSIDMGMTVAKTIIKKHNREEWKEDRKRFKTYIVVD